MFVFLWLVITALLVTIPLLGNEIRLWIDERYDERAERNGRHATGTAGALTMHELIRRDRIAQDRELFARIAKDFEISAMDWHTDRLVPDDSAWFIVHNALSGKV